MGIWQTGSQGRAEQMFADQFEQSGGDYIYRKDQKGEAYRISAAERDRFVESFDQALHRAKWIMFGGVTLVFVAIMLVSLRTDDASPVAIYAGIIPVIVPYYVYYRRAWSAPARELEGRMPIAGERPPEEVQRLRFKRISYGQLGTAALGGLMIPFAGSAHTDVFSGWGRLWLLFGGALVLLAAVQAFRKWRFDQDDSWQNVGRPPLSGHAQGPNDGRDPPTSGKWPFVLAAVAVITGAVLFLTPAGKRIVAQPSFMPVLIGGAGAWSFFTVARGLSKGRVQPFVRGFNQTFERDTQPMRFWASIAWNSVFGCILLGFAFFVVPGSRTQALEARCHDERSSLDDISTACSELIKLDPGNADAHPEHERG